MYIVILHGSQRLRDYAGLAALLPTIPKKRRCRPRLSKREAQSAPPGGVSRQVLICECLVRQSLSTILLQYDSLTKAHRHCLCDIAHFPSAQCTASCSCRCRPLPIQEIVYSVLGRYPGNEQGPKSVRTLEGIADPGDGDRDCRSPLDNTGACFALGFKLTHYRPRRWLRNVRRAAAATG
jgi:hypothetical protein